MLIVYLTLAIILLAMVLLALPTLQERRKRKSERPNFGPTIGQHKVG